MLLEAVVSPCADLKMAICRVKVGKSLRAKISGGYCWHPVSEANVSSEGALT